MKIDEINATLMNQLRFRDFAELKSGRDSFSRLKLAQLATMVSCSDVAAVEAAFEHDRERASCYRWILRGLNQDKAVRKVKTDAEITANAIRGRAA